MFKIYDGRSHFYQWDTDRKLIVEDASISEVHFCNQTDSYSLVCKTYIEDGLNLVNVPNILLQNDWRINVYAYDSNYTKFSEQFDVIRRCKPEDYVYTETEILNYNTLSDRITKIEEGGAGLAPLVGTTQTITPSQVLAAIKEGRDIALQYTDSYYGTFVFSAFNANEKLGIVVSNSILPQWDGLTGTLIGFVDDAGWVFKATNTATKDDVGTAVNEALTAAKASGEFDGITPTIGNNGNWFLGDTDTGKPSRGDNGKSAYSYAQEGGYTGTEAEFAAKLAAEKLPNPYPLTFTGAVNETYDGSSEKTITIPSGGSGASGLCIYDNYDVTLISFAQIDEATLPIDAGIEITTDDNGNPFSYDGLVVWTDIKSGASYTDIDFNNVKNCHYPIQHGVKDGMNMYVVDGTSMRAIVGTKSCVYIRQTRDDVNAAFYPAPNIEQLPEKITAIHLCPRNKVVSGTFYKIWGLTKK